MRSPYPYHGAKTGEGARIIWEALGNVPNYVDAACGSLSPVLLRPSAPKVETCNDIDGFVTCFWRAIQEDPEAVAYWADRPVNELDMHAIRKWLLKQATPEWIERMREDIDFFDAKIAGRWVWGMAIWIGGGFCDPATLGQKKRPNICGNGQSHTPREGIGINRPQLPRLNGCDGSGVSYGAGINRGELCQIPQLSGSNGTGVAYGTGINRGELVPGKGLPHLRGPRNPGGKGVGYGRGIFASERGQELREYFILIYQRVRRIRFTCGDFMRVLTPAVTTDHGLTGVLLDMPYGSGSGRKTKLYVHDDASVETKRVRKPRTPSADSPAVRAREWAIQNGDNPLFRIVLCGYAGEHDAHMPSTWRQAAWKSHSGYKNADKERIWLSPHCIGMSDQLVLFG